MGVGCRTVVRMIGHPGGAKVLVALESALDVAPGTLDVEREVMRDFGNMSSPTALFVLDRALQSGLPPFSILAALGSAFTASFFALANAR